MSTSAKQGPVKLSISQISSRDLVQILLRGSGNQSEIHGIQEFLSLSSLLLKAFPFPVVLPSLWAHLQSWLSLLLPAQHTGTPGQAGVRDTSQAQPNHGIPAEFPEKTLSFSYPNTTELRNQGSEE